MDISENYLPYVVKDFKTGPESPRHLISKVAALTYLRYKNGKLQLLLSAWTTVHITGMF